MPERTESALVLTDEDWEALGGVCGHYLYATRWADDPNQPAASKVVEARRDVCERICAVVASSSQEGRDA